MPEQPAYKMVLQSVWGITCLLTATLVTAAHCRPPHDEQLLYQKLLARYVNSVKPQVNQTSRTLDILFSIRLNQIVQLDERQQVLTTNVFIDQTWTDPALAWDPGEFQDVRSLTIPEDQVWRPDTFMFNNADNGSSGFIHGTYVQIRHSGLVTWPASVRLRSSCVVKIAYFPFDYQQCPLKFGSWIYNHPEVNYRVRPETLSVDMSTYINNSQWELLDMTLDRVVLDNTTRDLRKLVHLVATLSLKRNTFFYLFNIIVPCAMLSLLTLMTFWLPPTSGEKITLGLSVFLAFSMFMLLIAEEVPASSDAVPLIGIYLCSVMTMTVVSVIFAVLITNLHNRGSKLRRAPLWLRTACIKHLACVFAVNRDVPLLASTITMSPKHKQFILQDFWTKKPKSNSRRGSKHVRSRNGKVKAHQSPDDYSSDDHFSSDIMSDDSLADSVSPHYNNDHEPACHSGICENSHTHSGDISSLTLVHCSTAQDYDTAPYQRSFSTEDIGQIQPPHMSPPPPAHPANHIVLPNSSPLIGSYLSCDSECSEDVWVLRDDYKGPSSPQGDGTSQNGKTSCPCMETVISTGEEINAVNLAFENGTGSPNDTPLAGRRSHRAKRSSSNYPVASVIKQKKYQRDSELHMRKVEQHILRHARKMTAEWNLIAKVVDRLLFTFTLVLTIFAYVFILVIIPADYIRDCAPQGNV